jgi:hypothetical protein
MFRACLIRLVHEHAYSTEFVLINVDRTLPKGSKLEKFNAYTSQCFILINWHTEN